MFAWEYQTKYYISNHYSDMKKLNWPEKRLELDWSSCENVCRKNKESMKWKLIKRKMNSKGITEKTL